ncbi:MAG TPA: FHA domain-containing protein, partial [Polyangiaceae bacterium]|nr:FHA domain-containing protein [Polyangiaceae bacterium]
MGVLSKAISLFRGRDRRLDGARREEARGNLEAALALYLEAGAREDAARLQMARAEMAASPQERYQLLGQALALAQAEARGPIIRRRAELALVLFRQGSLVLTRPELLALAREVERSAAPALAAELYELGGDLESRTRALVEAGAIDQLEQVLSDEAESERARRERDAEVRKISDLDACGRRREALALARALEQEDERVRALAGRI